MKNILAKQQQLIALIHAVHGAPDLTAKGTIVSYVKDQAFFLNQEVVELCEAIGGSRDILKPWKVAHKELSAEAVDITDHIKSEAIDALCFCMNICLAAGITPENIEEEYSKVWEKNMERHNNGY